MIARLLKRSLAAFLALVLCLSLPLTAFAAIQGSDYVGSTTVTDRGLTITEAPTVDARYGILVDSDGTVLWSRGADTHSAMASITKITTAIVAIENGKMDDTYTISANAASVGESSAGLQAGEKVSLYNLLCALLIHSGNDAATAIAEGIGGSVDNFVAMMNAKAQALGLKNTHYVNPHGLDATGHYSSAYDISVLARYAMTLPTFREIVGMKRATVNFGDRSVTFKSTNSLLNTWSECIGIKTGTTDNAGYCLASAAKENGEELYAVVLGCSTETERFTDSYKLLAWGFSHYRSYTLASASDTLVDVPLSGFLDKTVPAGVAQDTSAYVLDYDGDISVDVSLLDMSDGVSAGDRVGTITWRQGEKVVCSAPLVAKENVGGPWAVVSVWTAICRLVGFFTGDDCVAQSKLYAQTVEVKRNDDLSGETIGDKLQQSIESDAATQEG